MPEESETTGIKFLAPGEAHLQNNILMDGQCYICKKEVSDISVLLRLNHNQMVFACTNHPGVVQEFVRQFKATPLGWSKHATESNSKEA